MCRKIIKQKEESGKQRGIGATSRYPDRKSKGKIQLNSELETDKQSNVHREKRHGQRLPTRQPRNQKQSKINSNRSALRDENYLPDKENRCGLPEIYVVLRDPISDMRTARGRF